LQVALPLRQKGMNTTFVAARSKRRSAQCYEKEVS